MRHATGWLVLGIVGCAAAAACSSTTGDSPSGAPVGDVAPTPRSDAATVTPGTPTPDGGIVTVDAASNDSAVAADTYVPVPDAALPDGAPDYDTDLAAAITNAKLTGNPANGIVAPPATMVALGRALFFDRILSASGDIACGTCHHPTLGGSDGARLSRGVGGTGFGPTREAGNGMLISRRAPSVWNAALLPNQFWDGRVRMIDPADASKGFQCPSQEIRKDVASIIAEQAEFPVVTGQEMRGDNFNGQPEQVVRDAAAGRVAGVAGYAPMFTSAFGDSTVTYSRIATAIGAYETSLLPLDTPWFRYVKTHAPAALSDDAKRGALLFLRQSRLQLLP